MENMEVKTDYFKVIVFDLCRFDILKSQNLINLSNPWYDNIRVLMIYYLENLLLEAINYGSKILICSEFRLFKDAVRHVRFLLQ